MGQSACLDPDLDAARDVLITIERSGELVAVLAAVPPQIEHVWENEHVGGAGLDAESAKQIQQTSPRSALLDHGRTSGVHPDEVGLERILRSVSTFGKWDRVHVLEHMRVKVDEAGHDELPFRVDHPRSQECHIRPDDSGNSALMDRNPSLTIDAVGGIDHMPADDDEVVNHGLPSPCAPRQLRGSILVRVVVGEFSD